ncbi:MAG TPA: GntG family PLP-dependent aldolase [Ktedonobacteraceae bacterium]|nr:GntG family PLP-dependent aldolase [Ktedonobacteraceae bacterium]
MIDLRSDTVSLPSDEMRHAMYTAELGDDVMGEDDLVNSLETRAAELLGKEAAIFMPSGTQANLVAILSHCQRGDEIILGTESHIFHYELAGSAAIAGVQSLLVHNQLSGQFDMQQLASSFRPQGMLHPPTTLVCLENTQARCSGAPLDEIHTEDVVKIARKHSVPVHLDGARLFNAAIALNVSAKRLAAPVDSVAFSLCKGLSAPVGSLLCGTTTFIQQARRWRKALGGAMHQAGILAAAGIYALDHMIDRLGEDHYHASLLAEALTDLPGIDVNPELVRTNIIIVTLTKQNMPVQPFLSRLATHHVLGLPFGPDSVRFVTHKDIKRDHIALAASAIRSALEENSSVGGFFSQYQPPLNL